MTHKVLVVTQPPFEGGVPAKTRILCRHLLDLGHRVTVAWYATFHRDSDLNAPSWRVPFGQRPATRAQTCFGHVPGIAVGCWCPELEAPYYLDSARWRDLIAGHDRHIAVGGPPLVGHPLATSKIPFMVWCASDVAADRADRVAAMPVARRAIHNSIIMPVLTRMQRRVLDRASVVLGVSSYTVERLRRHECPPDGLAVMHIPTDHVRFSAPSEPAPAGVIGFAARFEDPRKNLPMLLEAVSRLRHTGIRLKLAGCQPAQATRALVAALGLDGIVDFVGDVPAEGLPDFYRSLDVFALPSHQEGLCISGIEAMACGVPVVSTRCGGPEDYVRHDESGLLCGFDSASMADSLNAIIQDRPLRDRLSLAGQSFVREHFSHTAFAGRLADAWGNVWGGTP